MNPTPFKIAAWIDGPMPPPLALGPGHAPDLLERVKTLAAAIDAAEQSARVNPCDRDAVAALLGLRVYLQGCEGLAVKAAMQSDRELSDLFRCTVANAERCRRIRRALDLLPRTEPKTISGTTPGDRNNPPGHRQRN